MIFHLEFHLEFKQIQLKLFWKIRIERLYILKFLGVIIVKILQSYIMYKNKISKDLGILIKARK